MEMGLKKPGAPAAPVSKAPAKKAASPVSKRVAPRPVESDDGEDEGAGWRGAQKKAAAATKKAAATKATSFRQVPNNDRTVAAGWGGADQVHAETAGWAKSAQWTDGETKVLGFLDTGGPYATTKAHWIEGKKRRSFVCIGPDCPLCAVGLDVRSTTHFNVYVLTQQEPALMSWDVPKTRYAELKSLNQDPREGPLHKYLYRVRRTGSKMNNTKYQIARLRKGEIEEDFSDLHIPTTEEIEALREARYDSDTVLGQMKSREFLQEIADALADGLELDGGEDDE